MEDSKEQLKELNKKIKNEKFLKDFPQNIGITKILICYIRIINLFNEVVKSVSPSEIKETLEEDKRISGFSQDEYNEHFKKTIESHEVVGNHGWVLGPQLEFDDEQHIYNQIKQGVDEKDLVKFFFKKKEDVFKYFEGISKKYKQMTNLKLYFDKALVCYKASDFSSTAFYLCAVFEQRLAYYVPQYKKMTNKAEKGIKEFGKQYFNQLKTNNKTNGFTETYYLLYFFPSFSTFCKRLFVDGEEHDFNRGTEPEYLNRNWFVHGKMTRAVEEYEVLQLLNALMALEDAIEYNDN